jgi:hypothetical protein
MANTNRVWFTGGEAHRKDTCDDCGASTTVAHIGWAKGRIGSAVFHCADCITDGRTVAHYMATEYTPELQELARNALGLPPVSAAQVIELDQSPANVVNYSQAQSDSTQSSAQSAVGVRMKNTKKKTTKKPVANKKAENAVVPVGTLNAAFADDGSSPNYRRFKLQSKGAPLAGSVYIQPDLVPEGCSGIVVTITFKEA